MKARPMLMSAPMVRAILAGTKTQTRRVVKPQFVADAMPVEMPATDPAGGWVVPGHSGTWWCEAAANPDDARRCPYGQPGDRLWVRETWQVARETLDYETGGEYDVWEWNDDMGDPSQYLKGDARFGTKAGLFYAADGEDKNPGAFYNLTGLDNKTILRTKEINWRPSIHMPRWASRITLEVTGVRVERLQDISDDDAAAEGIERTRRGDMWRTYRPDCVQHWNTDAELGHKLASSSYASLWESINGPGSWEANPWVWVVEFKRLEVQQ